MDVPILLCIDDCLQLLQLRKASLEGHGYHVKMALSSRTALKILQDQPVDAVLLEYKTEGADPQAVAYHLKTRFPNIPIILVSAYSCTPERLLWLVDEYVLRSELSERLIPAIEQVTRRSQNRRDTQRASRANVA